MIIVAAVLAALVVLGGATYAYDHARTDTIAKGIRVAGVDIGGLKADAARAKLQTSIEGRLQQPVIVRHRDETWRLGPRRAHTRVDLEPIIDEALAKSREGNALTRSVRSLTGRSLDEQLQPTITFSDKAVNRLVRRVGRQVDRPARDAKVEFDGSGLNPVPSRDGVRVRTKKLRRGIRTELVSLSADRTVEVRTRAIKPKISSREVDREYATAILVNRSAFSLTLYKHLKPMKTYGIAVGQVGLETPAGLYHIENKAVNPAWSVPNSAWAGSLAGRGHPRRDGAEPAEGALAGDLRRRGDPRHERRRLDRQRGLARLHPDAHPGRDRPVRPRSRRRSGLHRLTPSGPRRRCRSRDPATDGSGACRRRDRPHRDLLPAGRGQGGVVIGVSKHERADEDTPLTPAHDRVPHRRRVAGPLDAVPRARRERTPGHHAGVDELALGGDLTRVGVDEEHGHVARG